MKRVHLNFLIDAVAFVALVLLASTGLLMHYVLPPGSGHFSTLWGMDRHEWGQLHFWMAVVLVVCLGLHLILHWRWVVSMVEGSPGGGSGIRVALFVVGVMALVGVAVMPFLGRVEQTGEPPHRMRDAAPAEPEGFHIDGSMTLTDVETLTGVPPAVVLRGLGLPDSLPTNERLGRLRKEHGFELQDVREVVRKQVERQ